MTASVRWLCLAALVAGCSSSPAPARVTGLLTLDGKPLPDMLVTFRGKAMEGEFGGRTGPDGRFDVAVNGRAGQYGKAGQYAVVVTTHPNSGISVPPAKVAADDEKGMAELMKGRVPGLSRGPVPEMYTRASTSPLAVEIKDGTTELEPLDLKTDSSQR
jgi:hypothetical protein